MKRILGAALLAVLSPLACAAELRDAKSVLQELEGATESAAPSNSSQLLADLQQFRRQYKQLSPRVAAERWFEYLDRARALPPGTSFEPAGFDPDIRQAVGIRSVLASIPAPTAWPEMRNIAVARAKKAGPSDMDALAIQLLADALNNDGAAVQVTLAKIEAATKQLAPAIREQMMDMLLNSRLNIASMYGTSEDVVATYTAMLDFAEQGESPTTLLTPDLVGMIGVDRASPLLRRAVTSRAVVMVQSGVETRRLARHIALENIAQMSVPQWQLVDSIDAAALYEAIHERFRAHNSDSLDDARGGTQPVEADIYYLLSTIVARQQQKAEAALARVARNGHLYLPQPAVKALRIAGQNAPLVDFLHAAISKQPELRAWDVYIEQSSYVGRSQQALDLLREVKKRPGLPPHLQQELATREIEALLANNRIEPAIVALRAQIAIKPGDDKHEVARHIATTTRLARIGRLLERRDLVNEGLTAARAALSLANSPNEYERSVQLGHVYETYRRTGDAAGAQSVALAELARAPGDAEQVEHFGLGVATTKRKALIELAGIYVGANRYQDALAILREAKQWGARDLGEFVAEKDSLGTPVGYAAARALAETNERDAALRVLRALIERSAGYDAGYELFVKLTGSQSLAELDAMYFRDPFEERPLIWKARVLLDTKQLREAEDVIRRAIAIDPSDGEQPANDRLRAYSVLADIVEAKGQSKDAAVYRQALEAIRISEQADQFHALGLYDRAFTMYRDSLARFSDAYCIQSRLAIQLSRQGRHQEAVAHYRRAYELMPDSFGRVESHCFGCENVFIDSNAQGIAEQVFTQALERDREKPQAHYLLGYLRKEQGRHEEALQSFRNAVALDDNYLNAWKQLHELGELTYIAPAEREIAQRKLLQLDPRQQHVQHELPQVRNIADFWNAIDRQQVAATTENESTFVLTANARKLDDALTSLPPELRARAELMTGNSGSYQGSRAARDPRIFLAGHAITQLVAQLMRADRAYY